MRKKKMILLLIIFVLIALVILWFSIPYSPFKNRFKKDLTKQTQISESFLGEASNAVYAKEDFESLPPLLRAYIEECGYIGSPRKSVLKMEYMKVDFELGQNRPKLKIDYTQVDFANILVRLAFIDSKMFGIPFQGYDYFVNGKGGMKGVLAKSFQLFNQTGEQMDKAALVTYLAEIIFLPEALLQDFVSFNQLDSNRVEAHIEYKGLKACGIYHFNDAHEMIYFSTDERSQTASDGSVKNIPWEAQCREYKLYSDGIKRPTVFRAVWKYPDQDFIYFDGKISSVNGEKPSLLKNIFRNHNSICGGYNQNENNRNLHKSDRLYKKVCRVD